MERNSSKYSGQRAEDGYTHLTSHVSRLTVLMIFASSFLLLLFVAGCKKAEEAPVQTIPVKEAAAPVQAAMTSAKKPEYVYEPAGKRDPFKTFIETDKLAHVSKVPPTPLQGYDVSVLRLVGVLLLPGKKIAIIEDPAGKGYHVKEGTLIGVNDGKVINIEKDEVVIEERYMDELGQSKVRKVSMLIPKEQGGEGR